MSEYHDWISIYIHSVNIPYMDTLYGIKIHYEMILIASKVDMYWISILKYWFLILLNSLPVCLKITAHIELMTTVVPSIRAWKEAGCLCSEPFLRHLYCSTICSLWHYSPGPCLPIFMSAVGIRLMAFVRDAWSVLLQDCAGIHSTLRIEWDGCVPAACPTQTLFSMAAHGGSCADAHIWCTCACFPNTDSWR